MPDPDPARKATKYLPLADWLATQPGPLVSLTFVEIEQILGTVLPATARIQPSWWTRAHRDRPQVYAWRAAGWEACAVDKQARIVTFRQLQTPPPGETP
jgi:hypothetical protein